MNFDLWTVLGETTLHVESSRIEECMEYYFKHQVHELCVNYARGFDRRDIDFLQSYPDVGSLSLVLSPMFETDISALRSLRKLRRLHCNISINVSAVDHPNLEEFRGKWNPSHHYDDFAHLRVLGLSDFRPPSKDLTGLAAPLSLRNLKLVQPKIQTLTGLARFSELEELELAYVPKNVVDFADVGLLTHLIRLELEKCKGIQSYEFLKNLTQLEWLEISGCADLPSVKFLEHLPALQHFSFVETTVVDGDLSPVLRLPYVGFFGKRHYSHTPSQVEKIIRQRQ